MSSKERDDGKGRRKGKDQGETRRSCNKWMERKLENRISPDSAGPGNSEQGCHEQGRGKRKGWKRKENLKKRWPWRDPCEQNFDESNVANILFGQPESGRRVDESIQSLLE